jgi:vacuolar-type H+-ATPase subunit H
MSMYENHSARDVAEHARDAGVDVARTARDDAAQVMQVARDAGADVARTAKDEAGHVVQEATTQAHRVTDDLRQRARDEVDRQHRSVVDRVGAFAEELATMAGEQPQTPARELVGLLAARSSAFAEYLDQHGPEKVLDELQDFARRRPGTFIVAAVATGFVVGRLSKGLWQNQRGSSPS